MGQSCWRAHRTRIDFYLWSVRARGPRPYHDKNMAKFISTHAIACMTRQDVARLLKRFKAEENTDVRNIRVLCDTLSGRMVCEWEARDRVALVEWLKQCNVQIRGTGEWLMAVQYESVDDALVTPQRDNP